MNLRETIEFPLIRSNRWRVDARANTRIFGALLILLSLFNFYLIYLDYENSVPFLPHSHENITYNVNIFLIGWAFSIFIFLGVLALILRFPRWVAYSWYVYYSLFLITLWLVTVLGWGGVPTHIDIDARGDIAVGYLLLAVSTIGTPAILFYRDYRYRKSLKS